MYFLLGFSALQTISGSCIYLEKNDFLENHFQKIGGMSNIEKKVVYIPSNIETGYVSKTIVNPMLFHSYNFIFRRLPLAITEEMIMDTFEDYGIKKLQLIHNSEDEMIACLRLSNESAKKLFQLLNGKMIEIEGILYPIDMIMVEDYVKVKRSDELEVRKYELEKEEIHEEESEGTKSCNREQDCLNWVTIFMVILMAIFYGYYNDFLN